MADEKMRLVKSRNSFRPKFKRQQLHHKKKLKDTWRRPRGLQSKQRRLYAAKGRHPAPGYGAPKAIRGFQPSGMEEVLVHNVFGLEGINAETTAVRIAAAVGNKKREAIQVAAIELGIKVLNAKDTSRTAPEEEPVEEESFEEETETVEATEEESEEEEA